MARRIYSSIILLALVLAILVYSFKETQSRLVLILASSVVFILLSMGIHGLLAHSVHPKLKESTLAYPLLMGFVWAVLLLLFVFFIIPEICPDAFYLKT